MMKIKFTLFLLIFLPIYTFAQSVEIKPGTILPQMKSSQISNITSPKEGMLVFDISTKSYKYYKSGSWVELSSGPGGGRWINDGLDGLDERMIKNIEQGGFWSPGSPDFLQYVWHHSKPPRVVPVSGSGVRLMWVPGMAAFRAGVALGDSWDAENVGFYSFGTGLDPIASGENSVAMGIESRATGSNSLALIHGSASGYSSAAIGFGANSEGNSSFAAGYQASATGDYAVALGEASASGERSVALGKGNKAEGEFSFASGNMSLASGKSAIALGDAAQATAEYSIAMGKSSKASGNNSFAVGNSAEASGAGAVAIGTDVKAKGVYSFGLGAGIDISSSSFGAFALGDFHVLGSKLSPDNPNQFVARFRNGYKLYTNVALTKGVSIGAGGTSWTSISDSTQKENFIPANTEVVLNSVAQMRIGTWNYKGQDPSEYRHWGVMAQDFYKHFGQDKYGTIGNDTTIATADFDGVAFAAIKGLEERTRSLNEALQQAMSDGEKLEATNQILLAEIKKLKAKEEKNQELLTLILSELSTLKQENNYRSEE